jgi:hypothetical protein
MAEQPNTGPSRETSGASTPPIRPDAPPSDATPDPTAETSVHQTSGWSAAPELADAAEPPLPAVEPTEDVSVPADQVARDAGPVGAGGAAPPRSNGLRWAIALGGLAVVVAITVAILSLSASRPSPSVAVGYMPTDTMSYAEYRLDLPGDQRQKLASFLSTFPGFADQANIQPKLFEVFDRIVALASQNTQTYTTDIEPWFAGQIGMGASALTVQGAARAAASPLGDGTLFVAGIKDPQKATDWLKKTAGDGLTETTYNGETIYSTSGGQFSTGVAFAVTDKVLLGGSDAAVRAAIDSKGEGKLADDPEFKAAFGTVSGDYLGFSYTEYRALLQSVLGLAGPGSPLGTTTIDDEILAMVPAWQAATFRAGDDAILGEIVYPSIDFGYDGKNKRSTLISLAPPGTVFYAESHDIGAAFTALLDRFRNMPELRDTFGQIDQSAGMIGGFDGLFGWWGDVALVAAPTSDASFGGGLLIAPTDLEAANRTAATLRSLLVLAGGGAGIELRDVQHGDVTVTIVDFSGATGTEELPPGVKAELAYAVTKDVVVIGFGESFVTDVLDAGPGRSLADDTRFTDLLKRVGEENLGLSFIDIQGLRGLIEPLARQSADDTEWAFYEREIKPYIEHLDAFISAAREDGDLDRLPQVFTVK